MGKLRVNEAMIESLLSSQEGELATLSEMEKALEDAKKQLSDRAVTELLARLGPEMSEMWQECPSQQA